MRNALTQGTEILPGSLYPVNEDKSVVAQVTAVSGGIVSAVRTWDEGNREIYAQLLGAAPDVGSYVTLHRVGDFNSQGTLTFERHEETPTGASWVCFGKTPEIIFVLDLGYSRGCQVVFAADGNYSQVPDSTLPLTAIEPLSNFHDSTPPFQAGRIYPAIAGDDEYFVALGGFGSASRLVIRRATIAATDYDLYFWIDTSGKIVDFFAVEFDDNYYVRPDNSQETVGSAGNYFVGQKFYAPGDPHHSGANWWEIWFYDSYDSGDKEYGDYNYSLSQTQTEWGGTDPFYNNYVWGYRAGTGIANKTSFYPVGTRAWYSSGISTPGDEETPEGFAQAHENYLSGGINITRSSYFYSSTDKDIFSEWNLSIASSASQRRYYDPSTDTASDSRTAGNVDHGMLDSAGVGSTTGNAHRGFNDEANDFIIYCSGCNWPSGKQQTTLPGWPSGPDDAVIYTHAKFVEGHNFTGGRVYFVRDPNEIWVHLATGGWQRIADIAGFDPDTTVYSSTAYVAEFWGSWRRRGRSLYTTIIWIAGTYEP